jgi:ABC-type branched-subunit amino acid transport system ATPase component
VSAAPPAVVEALAVRVDFQGVTALGGVDLAVRQGEILGLIGPNGAGKTTLVNVLSGFEQPTSGTVALNGRDITTWAPDAIARAGLVRTFQGARLFGGLTVFENVEVAAVSAGASRRDARALTWELLADLQLEARAGLQAGALSHGEERRLAIGRALALRPDCVLLDEPAAGLDEQESDELVGALTRIREAFGLSLLVIEHDMRLIMQLSDRIQVLDDGKTIAVGEPAEVRGDPAVLSAYLGTGERAHAARP